MKTFVYVIYAPTKDSPFHTLHPVAYGKLSHAKKVAKELVGEQIEFFDQDGSESPSINFKYLKAYRIGCDERSDCECSIHRLELTCVPTTER